MARRGGRLPIALAAALAVLAVGCTDLPENTITLDDFVARADGICTRAAERLASRVGPAGVDPGGPDTLSAERALADRIDRLVETANLSIELRAEAEHFAALGRETTALLTRYREVFLAADRERAAKIYTELVAKGGERRTSGEAIGFEVCGTPLADLVGGGG